MGCSVGNRVRRALAFTGLLFVILMCPRPGNAKAEAGQTANMIAKIVPAVVRVVTVRPPGRPDALPSDPKVAASSSTDQTTMTFGSGYIIDPTGFIGINRHVIEGAISVFVATADGVRYPAQVVGMPAQADIALLRIYAGHALPFVKFGDSDKVRVGDEVIAIGSPFGFNNTVTSGIISATNRDIMESPCDDYLQTDAAINHGNSGGPLFNMAGEVIGMNSVVFAPTPAFAGIAFAVPSNDLRFVFSRLMKTGKIDAGMLPIHTQTVTWMLQQALAAPDLQGALVTSVQDESGGMPEDKIKPGDVIRAFNEQKVRDPRDLARKAAQTPAGSDIVLDILRGGENETVHVTIQAWPEAKAIVLNNDRPRTLGLDLASAHGENGNLVVTVASVDPTGTAADSGIQKGDIIVEVQQTPISEPDQAFRVFRAQSLLKHRFAAVLVERDKKLSWMSCAIPE